ncbi:hypothetical protein HSBAA_33040 [Vreelandella sulfidaeris]|uniref:Histone deacetylase domain-containing protein n=1 Tax=Vreelandella sulfidaeris TaxID=115553 RepID=A0A455UCH6_9GAMM|nr:hypothetical protein HSBAA_33040 [Halomonas sulfidaeris]
MITAYLTHPDCSLHHMGPEHPECPQRLEAIRARLSLAGLLQQTMQADAKEACEEALARVHPYAIYAPLKSACPKKVLSHWIATP